MTADDAIHVLDGHEITYLILDTSTYDPVLPPGISINRSAALSRQQPLVHPHQHVPAMRRNAGDKMDTWQIKGLLPRWQLPRWQLPGHASTAKPDTIQGGESSRLGSIGVTTRQGCRKSNPHKRTRHLPNMLQKHGFTRRRNKKPPRGLHT